jgi:hypothetical protein
MSQRENPPDANFVLGIQKVCVMTKYISDDLLPGRAMKEGRFAAMIDKHVPP